MNSKSFYDAHRNFALRTMLEYYISPGIRCKYDILDKKISQINHFPNALDLGCSGNSFLLFEEKIKHKLLLDLAEAPLKTYQKFEKKSKNNGRRKHLNQFLHPIIADICHLPYRSERLYLIGALDVLEHVKDDKLAFDEITRILKKKRYLILTVPHKMRYFDKQDKLIGHYRRYEIKHLKKVFLDRNYRVIDVFGVYGQLFKISKIQKYDSARIEEGIINIRDRYISSVFFRVIWNLFVPFLAFLMRIDARYQPLKRILNIGLLLQKIE